MRILQVVTLVSSTGAFGGPLRVAMNQSAELRRRGHRPVIAGGWQGEGPTPCELQGTSAHLFPSYSVVPTFGFSGMFSPLLTAWLIRHAREFEIVHIHAGRDLTSLVAMTIMRARSIPYVVQTHGMIQPDSRWIARLEDICLRPLLRSASSRLVLNEHEEALLRAQLGRAFALTTVRNGLEIRSVSPRSMNGLPEVLFCARLHERKRPASFIEMASILIAGGIRAKFTMIGPDEGELADICDRIKSSGLSSTLTYEGALSYEDVLPRLASVDIYVLPSVDEPFPMTLLEAMSVGTPSVCTDACGIAALLQNEKAAVVVSPSPSELARAVEGLLLDRDAWQSVSRAAVRTTERYFGMSPVVAELEEVYIAAIRNGDSPGRRHFHKFPWRVRNHRSRDDASRDG